MREDGTSSGDGAPGDGKHGAIPFSTHFKLLPEEIQYVTAITLLPLWVIYSHA